MKNPIVPALAIFLALSLLATHPVPANAASKGKKPKPTPVPEKVNARDGRIEHVSNDSIAVKYSKTVQNYKIDGRTQIQFNGGKATANDLKPSMHADVDESKITPGLAMFITAQNASGK